MLAALAGTAAICGQAETEAPQATLREVQALDHNGQYERAIRGYRDLLRQYPGSPEVRLGLAQDLARTGQCRPTDPPASQNSASAGSRAAQDAVIGICSFRRSDFPTALAHLEAAEALAPADKQIRIFLARAYAASGQAEKGIDTLKRFESDHGDDPDILYWTGALYDQQAEHTYDAMVQAYPGSYLVLETQGQQFLARQEYDKALESFEKVLEAAPNAPGLHFDLGNTYWRMAKLDRAAAELSAELKINPNHAQANYELGDVAVKQGDFGRGLPLLEKALALDPSLTGAHKSLGRCFLAEHEYAKAVREFLIVAAADPSDHTIHALLANAYRRMGRTQEAEEETRKYNQLMKQQMSELQQRSARQASDSGPAGPVAAH